MAKEEKKPGFEKKRKKSFFKFLTACRWFKMVQVAIFHIRVSSREPLLTSHASPDPLHAGGGLAPRTLRRWVMPAIEGEDDWASSQPCRHGMACHEGTRTALPGAREGAGTGTAWQD